LHGVVAKQAVKSLITMYGMAKRLQPLLPMYCKQAFGLDGGSMRELTYDELFMLIINDEGVIMDEILSSVLPPRYGERSLTKKSYRDAILIFFGAECFICGYKNFVDIHHIVHKSKGGTDQVDNLVLLCPNHHKEWHYYENTFIIGIGEPNERANKVLAMDWSIPESVMNGRMIPFFERIEQLKGKK
jgi:hypothetical protein